MGFLLCKAVIDGEERLCPIPESGLPHLPQWTAVDPKDVRANPWDFEEPEPEENAVPDVGPSGEEPLPIEDVHLPPADETPPGNASAADWRAYAQTRDVANPDSYSRDELRDHFLNDQPLPSEESRHG